MNLMNTYIILVLSFLINLPKINAQEKIIDHITIAILAKDKAHTLPLYLSCIEAQTWPANKTYLYIRTNNNNDQTADILRAWIARVQSKYAAIYFDDNDVDEPIQCFKQHEWNCTRFKILGQIRQESINWAFKHTSHYFVADCDNFIKPHTIENLLQTNLPIVAPLLRTGTTLYSNFHAAIDQNGYFIPSSLYFQLLNGEVKGLIELPVVHCTYLIRYEHLNAMLYDDTSNRYEYVIFSDNARKKNIAQYLDTRELYGYISFAENSDEFFKEPWLSEFQQ